MTYLLQHLSTFRAVHILSACISSHESLVAFKQGMQSAFWMSTIVLYSPFAYYFSLLAHYRPVDGGVIFLGKKDSFSIPCTTQPGRMSRQRPGVDLEIEVGHKAEADFESTQFGGADPTDFSQPTV